MKNASKAAKNIPVASVMSEGYGIEVDGWLKSQFPTSTAALQAAKELKKRFPHILVKIYDAKKKTRTVVELS